MVELTDGEREVRCGMKKRKMLGSLDALPTYRILAYSK